MFAAYLKLGFEHILDPQGYDHILFVLALAILYRPKQWRKVIVLVTAFTLGHSLTLALSALDLVKVNAQLVETLIPITIVLTALYNIFVHKDSSKKLQANYGLAAGFGLIHGLGFSNYFKAILGKEESVFMPLLSFNIGVELGQIIIVALTLLFTHFVVTFLKWEHKKWMVGVSATVLCLASYLMFF